MPGTPVPPATNPLQYRVVKDQIGGTDLLLPAPGYLQVSVMAATHRWCRPGPRQLQVLGLIPVPGRANWPVFGDDSNQLPYGVALVEFIDRDGISEPLALEPGITRW